MQKQEKNNPDQKSKRGWVFYREPGENDIIFICGDIIPGIGEDGFWISPFEGESFNIKEDRSLRLADINELNPVIDTPSFQSETEKGDFIRNVSIALEEIKAGKLGKVVLSRTKKIELPEDFKPFTFLFSLRNSYPDAFTYLLYHPDFGLWTGCTPEMLVKVNADKIETMSLAGTGSTPQDFSEKEKREQALVSDYIKETISPYCKSVRMNDVSVKKAGEIYHLCTTITGTKKPEAKLATIVEALHPTPAVCGSPKKSALNFIHVNEHHDRKLYSGYLGYIASGSGTLYVNLRCMQISGNEGMLYAGAGIVSGSDPEAEWEETNKKMDTLLRVIFSDGH